MQTKDRPFFWEINSPEVCRQIERAALAWFDCEMVAMRDRNKIERQKAKSTAPTGDDSAPPAPPDAQPSPGIDPTDAKRHLIDAIVDGLAVYPAGRRAIKAILKKIE